MFKILLILSLGLFAWANNLNITQGEIKAHTEVFGDGSINPSSKVIMSDLIIENSIETIKGKISFQTLSLISDKKDRDSNMYELLNSNKFATISFDIKNIKKSENFYIITGMLNLNGISKNISTKASISEQNNLILLNGNFSFNLTDFGIKPPKLLFLTVRNKIDITYNLSFSKRN